MKRKTKMVKGWPVRKGMCSTCPFREGGDKRTAASVLARTLFRASQICHHPVHEGKPEHELCRGARMHQLELLARMGWIESATDEAYERKCRELGVIN